MARRGNSNIDRYAEEYEDNRNYRAAFLLATQFSAGCGSKSAAWNWADRAIKDAAAVSPEFQEKLRTAAGRERWPNLDAMEELIETLP